MSLWNSNFVFFEVGSQGSSLYSFLRTLHTFLHSGYTNVLPTNSAQAFVIFSSHPHQHLLSLCLKKIFFLCGPFLKSLLNLLQYCLCFMFLAFWTGGMWYLSSPTRDRTCTPCIGRQSLNHWTTREVPLQVTFDCDGFSGFSCF